MKDFSRSPKTEIRPSKQLPEKKESRYTFMSLIYGISILGGLFIIFLTCLQIPEYLAETIDKSNIRIQGNKLLSEESILDFLAVDAQKSWYSLDPFDLSARLKQQSWIDLAMVHRNPGRGLNIKITERQPIAYLKSSNQLFLLGSDFLVLNTISSSGKLDLPIIVDHNLKGIKAGDLIQKANLTRPFQLIELLKKNKTLPLDAISEIIITDPLNIKVVTIPEGIVVKFGYQGFEQKLANLHYALPHLNREGKRIKYIDLRQERGVVFKRKY